MGLIYCATFTNGKRYIGQTVQSLSDRISQHVWHSNNFMDDFLFHKAIRKYGINNIFWEILEDNIDTIDKLNKREEYWINNKNSYYLNGEGYNMTPGGDNYSHLYSFTIEECYKLFDEYKKCGSSSELGEKYNTTSSVILRNIKRVAPEEYKLYSRSGNMFTQEEKEEIYNYYIMTGSLKRTVEEFNSSTRTIQRILKNIDSNYFRFSWMYDINKEDAVFVYEDYKTIGNLDELAEKYGVGREAIRNILIYFDSEYSKYTKRRRKKSQI